MKDEECDDNNTIDKDGCSSSCKVEEYFECDTIVMPSKCMLTEMNTTVLCLAKVEDNN
jgi:cysteine-rich repeat protein